MFSRRKRCITKINVSYNSGSREGSIGSDNSTLWKTRFITSYSWGQRIRHYSLIKWECMQTPLELRLFDWNLAKMLHVPWEQRLQWSLRVTRRRSKVFDRNKVSILTPCWWFSEQSTCLPSTALSFSSYFAKLCERIPDSSVYVSKAGFVWIFV